MTVKVRDFQPDDLDWVSKLRSLAFGAPAWASMPLDGWRGFVAELPGGPCGFLRIYDYRQFFGGRAVPMGGIASVSVDPYARGRGVASALLDTSLAALRSAGQCLSVLYPSVPPLYRGRGWEQAGVLEWLDLRTDALRDVGANPLQLPVPIEPYGVGSTSVGSSGVGSSGVELRPGTQDDLGAMLAAYREVASGIDGMLDRDAAGFHALSLLTGQIRDLAVDEDGHVRGYLAAERSGGSDTLVVNEFVATDPAAATALLASIGSWAGQLEKVSIRVLDSAGSRQLLPLPAHYVARLQPWMLRVVDFPAAIAARGWPAGTVLRPCTVDVEIVDEYAPWHAGRHRLVVTDGAVACEPGGSGAVRLSARALGPWYAGAASTATLRRLGLLDGDPTAATVLDALVGGSAGSGGGGARLADTF
ncbi:MAG TPA: GNAT family N-acetyltransferase [Pseudonocardiaceae bacterium]|jgi:predicted acetyltransferase|nr:GNAT family N-acetyltransferase [Pseudonocardiaceae bacterium]